MANADDAIAFVLSNEDGFVDNPNDSGGATNFGLSLRFLRQIPADRLRKYGIFTPPELLTVVDIKHMDVGQAKIIYKGEFWDNARYAEIDSQSGANYVFDMAVLHGENQAIKILQRALWAARIKKGFITDDGVLGSLTIESVNVFTHGCGGLYLQLESALMAERAGFCRLLCEINPKNREFLDGWLNRCYRI
jgi:lysozyme family protein